MMVQKGFLPRIKNAKGRFQFVYVRDVAQAIAVSISNPAAFNQAYNLCNPQQVDYPLLADALTAAAGTHVEIRRMTWEQAQEQQERQAGPMPAVLRTTMLSMPIMK